MKPRLSVVGPRAHSRLRARTDVVLRKGRFALLNETLSPRDATLADLVAIHDALDKAGIEHLLVRRDDDRAVIAVDRLQYCETAAALT
ncbi:MAG: hypothetical protein ACRCSP_01220, partial [Rhodoglobus sp.]